MDYRMMQRRKIHLPFDGGRTTPCLLLVFGLSLPAFFPGPPAAAATVWEFTVEAGGSLRRHFPITNQCTAEHEFSIKKKPAFLTLDRQDGILIGAGDTVNIGLVVDGSSLKARRSPYIGELTVKCKDCHSEPGCLQDREDFEVRLTVEERSQDADCASCTCSEVTASAGAARVTGSGGLVVGRTLTVELDRKFRFQMECAGEKCDCVERVGVDAEDMTVAISDGRGNSATLTPNADSETRDGGSFIVLECACEQRAGGCEMSHRADVVYGAQFDMPQWAIDDLTDTPAVRVDATIESRWTPNSETGFCDLVTPDRFRTETASKRVVKIRE